jgi:hypothetical protein
VTDVFHYSLQQRVLASDCELPYLDNVAAADANLTLRLRTRASMPASMTPWYRAETVIDRTPTGDLVMRFTDATTFLISANGASIALVDAPSRYTHDDLAAYALGPVLAVALHLQGAVLIHAAGIVIGDKAVLFAGPAGSGKSTTAAVLHRLGYAFLSDDLIEIDGDRALPSPACIRLWPDVLDALYGSAAAFPDRAPSWEKKILRVDTRGPAARGTAGQRPTPQRIGAILFLDPSERGATPRLERVTPRDGWTRLIAEAYTARLPSEAMARTIFEATSALADRIPTYRFFAPALASSAGLGAFLERELA